MCVCTNRKACAVHAAPGCSGAESCATGVFRSLLVHASASRRNAASPWRFMGSNILLNQAIAEVTQPFHPTGRKHDSGLLQVRSRLRLRAMTSQNSWSVSIAWCRRIYVIEVKETTFIWRCYNGQDRVWTSVHLYPGHFG